MNVLRAGQLRALSPELLAIFGDDSDPIALVEARALQAFPAATPIVWECDAKSFEFGYVSASAVTMLGYPTANWLTPMFWADVVVHGDDRTDAVEYCSLATAKACDHMFEYRARARDGRILWLRDYVKVVPMPGTASAHRLRGLMFDVTAEKLAEASPVALKVPARSDLAA